MDTRYWARAAQALGGRLRADPQFRREWLSAGLAVGLAAPERSVLDLFPALESTPIAMGDITYRNSNMDPMEQYCVRAIATVLQPRRIFEIGTFDGATSLAMAQAAPTAEVLTLDLPPDLSSVSTGDEAHNVATGGVGARFAGTHEEARIAQLFGDSRTFDYSPWEGSVDLVLVDAGHDYEFAKADTQSALRLLRPGGVLIWDDYDPGWPGVVRAVDETGLPVVRLTHTGMAVLLS